MVAHMNFKEGSISNQHKEVMDGKLTRVEFDDNLNKEESVKQ